MFLFILASLLCSLLPYHIQWLVMSPELILLQSLTMYYFYRIALSGNIYQLVGYAALSLVLITSYLFYLQFDVFACFLIVSESIVMLFALTVLLHLNYTNISFWNRTPIVSVVLLLGFICGSISSYNNFSYWVDWYSTAESQTNDLLPQYIYFYIIDSPVVVIVGFWLLILTILLVQLILSLGVEGVSSANATTYSRKTQNIWTQWYKKAYIRFFKK